MSVLNQSIFRNAVIYMIVNQPNLTVMTAQMTGPFVARTIVPLSVVVMRVVAQSVGVNMLFV